MDNHLLIINDGTSLGALHGGGNTVERRLAEEAKQRTEEEKKTERSRKKSPSITHVRALKTWKTARLITLLRSLSCLRLYARQSGEALSGGPPPRANAPPQTYPPPFYSTRVTRPPFPLPPVFFAFHGTNKERFQARAATPLHDGY